MSTQTASTRSTDALGRRRRVSGGGSHFISDREICAREGYSMSTLWRMRRDGLFPPAVRISPGRNGTPIDVYNAHVARRLAKAYDDPEAA